MIGYNTSELKLMSHVFKFTPKAILIMFASFCSQYLNQNPFHDQANRRLIFSYQAIVAEFYEHV